jgi:glycosyltransferase involved in cell wall biosynthesis
MKLLTTLTTIDPLQGGGVCEAVFHLNNSIKSTNDDIQIAIYSLDYNTPKNIIKKWSIFDTRLFKAIDPFLYGLSFTLRKSVLNSNADILHNHGVWEFTSFISLSWKNKTKKPYMITTHGMLDIWALKNSSFKKKLMYKIVEKKYLENAVCLHALNKEEEKSIREIGLKVPICVIPNGIVIPDNQLKLSPIWDINLIQNRKVILFLGRFHPKKGLENLLYAWSNLTQKEKNKDWVIAIAGWSKDNYEKNLFDIVEKNNLKDNVFFLGSVLDDAKKSVLQNSDAFILPSFSEGLPISILEAMAYKLPVLMTKECNLSDAFINQSALEIQPNVESIEEGIIKIINMSSEDRNIIGENGFDFVKNRYSWEKVSHDMKSVYNWIMGKENKPSCVFTYKKD